jgi:hypothetical protein
LGLYDKFDISLAGLQAILLMGEGDEMARSTQLNDAMGAHTATEHHLLAPSTLQLRAEQCVRQDDPSLVKFKLDGALDNLHLHVSDRKCQALLNLLAEVAPSKAPPSPTPAKAAEQAPRSPAAAPHGGAHFMLSPDTPVSKMSGTSAAILAARRSARQRQRESQHERHTANNSHLAVPGAVGSMVQTSAVMGSAAASPGLKQLLPPSGASTPQLRRRAGSAISRARSEAEEEFYSCDEGSDVETEVATPFATPAPASVRPHVPVLDAHEAALAAARHVQAAVHFTIVDVRVFVEEDADGPAAKSLPEPERALLHSSVAGPPRVLLTLCIRELEVVRFVMREDMQAELRLKALEVHDNFAMAAENSQRPLYLVQSSPDTPLPCLDYVPSGDNLIQVAYTGCPDTSVLFHEEHGRVKTRADVTLGDLRVTARQETLRRMLGWTAVALTPPEQDAGQKAVAAALAKQETADSRARAAESDKNESDTDQEALQTQRPQSAAGDAATDVLAQARLGSIQVVLETNKGVLGSLLLAGAEAGVTVTPSLTTATAVLRSLRLADATRAPHRFQEVLTVRGEEVFKAKVQLHNRPPPAPGADPEAVPDLEADVNINQLQFIYLARFVADLSSFAAGMSPPAPPPKPPSPRAASLAPSTISRLSTAANQLQATADSVNEATGKMGLRITLAAPRILIPTSSDSATCAVLELGTMSITNCLALEAPPAGHLHVDTGRPAPLLIDHTTLALANVCLFFAELPEDKAQGLTIQENDRVSRAVLRPVSIELALSRCLQSKRHEIPTVTATITVPEINIHLNDEDYAAALAIAAGNLAEKPSLPPPVPDVRTSTDTKDKSKGSGDFSVDLNVDALELAAIEEEEDEDDENDAEMDRVSTPRKPPAPAPQQRRRSQEGVARDPVGRPRSITVAVREAMDRERGQEEVWINFAASFELGLISVELCRRKSPLAQLNIMGLMGQAKLSTDGTTNATISLTGISLCDMRNDSPSVHRCLIGTRIMPEAAATAGLALPPPTPSNLDAPVYHLMTVRYDALEGQQSLAATLDGLRVAVCMEFILALLAFVSSAAEMAPSSLHSEAASAAQAQVEPAPAPVPASATATAEDNGSLRVHLALRDPVITLVADHTKERSRALRLTLAMHLFYTASDFQQNASITMEDLKLGSLRAQGMTRRYVSILEPLEMVLSYSQDVATQKMTINANLGQLRLSVGYNDLQVVQSVLAALSSAPGEKMGAQRAGVGHTVNLGAHEAQRDKWYLRKVEDDAVSMLSKGAADDQQRLGRWTPTHLLSGAGDGAYINAAEWLTSSTAQLEIQSVDLTLIDDFEKQDCPLLLVSATLVANARNIASKTHPLQAWATLGLAVAYYNAAVSAWEPLLEPAVDRKWQAATPWELRAHLWVNHDPDGSGDANSSATSAQPAVRSFSASPPPDDAVTEEQEDELRELNEATDTLEYGELPGLSCLLSGERMELTVSNALYRTIMDCVFVAGEAAQQERAVAGRRKAPLSAMPEASVVHNGTEERHFAAFRLQNVTGHDLKLSLSPKYDAGLAQLVAEGDCVPLDFELDQDAARPMRALTIHHASPHRRLSLLIEGCQPVEDMAVDVVGAYARPLILEGGDGARRMWICTEVSLVGATKVVSIRSTFQVQNELEIPLDIAYTNRAGAIVELADVAPGDCYSLPLTVAYQGFHVRPAGLAYSYCQETLGWHYADRQFAHCQPAGILVESGAGGVASREVGRPTPAVTASGDAPAPAVGQEGEDLDVDLGVPSSPLVVGSAHAAAEAALQLQASNRRVKYDRGRPGKRHPENVLTFSAPVMLRNALPLDAQLRISSGDPELPDMTIFLPAGQDIPIFGGLRRKITAKLRWGSEEDMDAAETKERQWSTPMTLYKPGVLKVRVGQECREEVAAAFESGKRV